MAVKTASQTQWADLATKVRSAIGQGNLIPSFDNMTPVKTFTWSVSDATYRPVYQIANTGWDHTNMDINVAYRITVTGTNIKQVCDIEEHWHSPLTYPMTTLLNKTLSTSAATTGFRYLRAVYPVSGYLNNTTYPLGSEISNYDATARTIKVEVFLDDPAVTWNETKPSGSIYVSSTYNGNNSLTTYSTRGVVIRKAQSFAATSADSAGYATSCEMYTFNSSAVKAGEALTSGYLAYLADDGKVYKINNTTKNMVCDDAGKIGLISSAVSSGTAIAYNYFRPATNLNSTQVGYISHGTLALGNTVYLRCTKDSNGKIHSGNYLATAMSAGYTWCPIGIATATNTIALDARKPMFYTLDSAGRITHVNGKPTGIEDAAFIGTDVGTPSTVAYVATDNITDAAVTTAKLGPTAVTTAKIANGAVTSDKIDFTNILQFSSNQTGTTCTYRYATIGKTRLICGLTSSKTWTGTYATISCTIPSSALPQGTVVLPVQATTCGHTVDDNQWTHGTGGGTVGGTSGMTFSFSLLSTNSASKACQVAFTCWCILP